ncbi:MAG: hypothetical protein WCP11_03050 [Candidatus Saccharibacteria bacterium]
MSTKQIRAKKKILEQLEKIPIIEIALQKASVPRSTYYRWANDDPDFKEAAEEAQEKGYLAINDVAESKLIQKIKDGDWKATAYWLESNHKRYFKPRRPIVIGLGDKAPRPVLVEFVGKEPDDNR